MWHRVFTNPLQPPTLTLPGCSCLDVPTVLPASAVLFCSRLFRRCRRFCHLRRIHHSRSSRYFCRIRTQLIQFQVQRLIHAFHAFSLSNAKENSPPRVLNPQSLEQSGHKTDPQRGDSPTHWNNHPAYSPSNVPKHPDIGTIRTPTGLKTS